MLPETLTIFTGILTRNGLRRDDPFYCSVKSYSQLPRDNRHVYRIVSSRRDREFSLTGVSCQRISLSFSLGGIMRRVTLEKFRFSRAKKEHTRDTQAIFPSVPLLTKARGTTTSIKVLRQYHFPRI